MIGLTQKMVTCSLIAVLTALFSGLGLSEVVGSSERTVSVNGELSVLSEPQGATVYVDSEAQGVTPLRLHDLVPGEHRVTLAKDGYLQNSRVISVKAGQLHTVDVKLTPAVGDSRHAIQIQPEEGGGGSKLKWILPAAAGGGVAAYFLLRETNEPPSAGSINVSPTGPGLVAVTSFAFNSTASDPDGDALTYNWDFGDGSSGSGQSASHTYNNTGTFNVSVTVSDGKESASASTSVTVRDISGTWNGTSVFSSGYSWSFTFRLTQSGASVSGSFEAMGDTGSVSGGVSAPLNVTLTVKIPGYQAFTYTGTLSSDLNQITGSITGSGFTGERFTMRRQ